MKILCKKRTFSAAGIVLPLIVLALTSCPNKPGGGGGSDPGSPPPVIGNYNAVSETLTVGSITYMMKQITGGSGLNLGAGAGSGDNNGPHTVDLTPYHIGKTEVTQELYQAVMGSNPSQFTGSPASGEQQSKRPVDTVTWFECIEFCNKLTDGTAGLGASVKGNNLSGTNATPKFCQKGIKPPTEGGTEGGARGSTGTVYSGSGTAAGNVAWFTGNSNSKTHQVGKKPATPGNVYGLYDMSGNVWEWCWDLYKSAVPSGGTDPTGPAPAVGLTARTKRGGSWDTTDDKCKCVYRGGASPDDPGYADEKIGFRIVCRP